MHYCLAQDLPEGWEGGEKEVDEEKGCSAALP